MRLREAHLVDLREDLRVVHLVVSCKRVGERISAVNIYCIVYQLKGLLSPLSEGLDLKAFAQSPVALPRPSVPLVLGWRGLLERALWRGAGGPRDLEICCF